MAILKLPTPTADINAATLKIEFLDINEKSKYSTFSRWATDLTVMSGPDYSYALFTIPQTAIDELAGYTAASKSTSPKLRTRARVTYVEDRKQVVMLTGSVIVYGHDLDEDAVIGRVVDDRWHMGKVTCFGRVKCDPSTDAGVLWYDANEQLVFEPLSCVDSAVGPVFAPGFKWGHTINDFVSPSPGNARTKARNWRCEDVESYLRFCHTSHGSPLLRQNGYGNLRLNTNLKWPSNLANGSNWQRYATGMDLEGHSLLIAMQMLCRRAGPYDLYCLPGPGWSGTLSITDMSGRKGQALFNLPRSKSTYTMAQRMADPNHVQGGMLTEDASDYFDEAVIIGDPPVIESSFHDNLDPTVAYKSSLVRAWTQEREDAFKVFVTEGGNTKLAFQQACDIWPDVFAWYYIDPRVAPVFIEGSKYSNIPVHYTLKIMEHLVSSDNLGNADNPLEWEPLPLTVEVYNEKNYDGGNPTANLWEATDKMDGLALMLDNRIINLDGLRKKGGQTNQLSTWYISGDHGAYEGEYMTKNGIRLTCAVEHECRISSSNKSDPNVTYHRIRSYGSKRHSYQALSEKKDYVHWERKNSHPYGQEVDEPYKSESFPDRLNTDPVFSDIVPNGSRIQKHAYQRLKDVKRIGYGGALHMSRFNPSLRPGMSVNVDGSVIDTAVKSGTVIKSWTFSVLRQQQLVELSKADLSVIYDIPQSVQPEAQTPPPTKNTGEGEIKYEDQQYPENTSEDYRRDDYESSTSATGKVTKQASTPAPAKSERDAQREANAALVRMIEPAEAPRDRQKSKSDEIKKGQINQPGQTGWNRMKEEGTQTAKGIYTGESMKQLDHDRVKEQRRAEALTPAERRADASAEAGTKELSRGTGKSVAETNKYQRKAMMSGEEEEASRAETE